MRRLTFLSSSLCTSLRTSFAVLSLAGCASQASVQPATPVAHPTAPAPVVAGPVAFATTPDEAFRATKPAPLANEPAFTPPVPVQRTLKNGAQVLVVENHAVPLVAVHFVIGGGVDREPLDRRGLSGLVSDMLLEGTRTRSSLDIAIASERLAAQIWSTNDQEYTMVHLNALKETLPDALTLTADVLLNPAFKTDDFERVRGKTLTWFDAKKGEPDTLARDDMQLLIWGDKNPWGLPSGGTPASVNAITVEQLARFHRTYFVPNNTVISVAGDVTPDEAVAALEKVLGSWKRGNVPATTPVKYPPTQPRAIVFTDVPTATQSQVLIGARAPRANAAEMLPLEIANNVVGGLFSSRLNINLREDKAFTYGAFSWFALHRDASMFTASGAIVAEHTADAITEFERELQRMKTAPISDEELARAKQAIIRSVPSQLETNDSVSEAMATLFEQKRPLDDYKTLSQRVKAISKEDTAAAARKFIDPDHWPVVVVGPRSKTFDSLKALGIGDVKDVAP